MAYATIADMEQRLDPVALGQLTKQVVSSAEYNAAINAELEQASAVVDSYAGARYTLPLETSVRVTQITVDITAYELEKNRATVRETDRQAYEDAMKFLRDLSAGRAVLDQPAGADPQTTSAAVKVTDKTRAFSDTNLEGYK